MNIYFKEKIVGKLDGEIYKIIKKPEHFMRMYQGFGISLVILNELNSKGCKYIEITYLGLKGIKTYNFTIEEYLNSKLEYIGKENDKQKFVSIYKLDKLTNNSLYVKGGIEW